MTTVRATIYLRAEIDGDEPQFSISVVRGGHEYIHEDIHDHLYMENDLVLSAKQLRMPSGSVIRLVANVTMEYYKYWTDCGYEHDSRLIVDKIKVLKASAPTRKKTKQIDFKCRSIWRRWTPAKQWAPSTLESHSTQEIHSDPTNY